MDKIRHYGACHCGTVTFEVDAPAALEVLSCTCSMCAMTGFIHLIVEDADFRVTAGEGNLTEYRFNTGTARHLFCKTCGIKPFYVPRSHPNGWSVNANCLDRATIASVKTTEFDGANWESSIDSIR